MFNELDREALAEALWIMTSRRLGARTWELTADDLAAALDAAGVTGLFHDGARAARRCAGNDPFARIR